MRPNVLPIKVLVLPVYRRHWLYHAWIDRADTSAQQSGPWWQAGPALQDKANALQAGVKQKFQNFVEKQWSEVVAAKEGTFRHWLYRLALYVKSREDPTESFLKKLPRTGSQHDRVMVLQVLYPSSMDPVLLRRRFRRVALSNATAHKRALLGWSLACLPQAPLVLTPFPNVTLYYSVYRWLSHFQAWGGSEALHAACCNPASERLQRAFEDVQDSLKQHPGGGLWRRRYRKDTDKLSLGRSELSRLGALTPEQRLESLLHRLGLHTSHIGGPNDDSQQHRLHVKGIDLEQLVLNKQPLVVFIPSNQLDEVVRPMDRWRTPLEGSVLKQMNDMHWNLEGLDEHLSRVRRAALTIEAKHDKQRGRPAISIPVLDDAPTFWGTIWPKKKSNNSAQSDMQQKQPGSSTASLHQHQQTREFSTGRSQSHQAACAAAILPAWRFGGMKYAYMS